MPTWDELWKQERFIKKGPASEVYNFFQLLESDFEERPLRFWDLCCGAGRHTLLAAKVGMDTYATDNAARAIEITKNRLEANGLEGRVELADMTECPWPDVRFHGVLAWGAIHHNTLDNIKKTVANVHEHMIPGGYFMLNLISTKANSYGQGREIEPGTYLREDEVEGGIPHHYFDEEGVRELFANWKIEILAENIVKYLEKSNNFSDSNPFSWTNWSLLAKP